MKKTTLMACTLLLTCAVFAQDSVRTNTQGQHHNMAHKKTMHKSASIDSVNAGKITTNPHGKMKKPKNSAASIPDSAK